jgi:AraC-like DNA-binding protein
MTKYIANQPISVDFGFDTNPSKPILSVSLDVSETQCADKHAHPRAQLIYSSKGTMKVVTPKSIWYVSPNQAIWVPGMNEHQVFFLNDNHIRNIFVSPPYAKALPQQFFALNISPFMRELILKVVGIGNNYDMNGVEGRLVNVLIDELDAMTPTRCFLPLSDNFHLQLVINKLLKNPGDTRGVEHFAGIACTSSRTLSRLFIKELGLSFRNWRKQLRLLTALEMLDKGISVSQISFELGYNSSSAFIEMFRKEFGVPPGKYISTSES